MGPTILSTTTIGARLLDAGEGFAPTRMLNMLLPPSGFQPRCYAWSNLAVGPQACWPAIRSQRPRRTGSKITREGRAVAAGHAPTAAQARAGLTAGTHSRLSAQVLAGPTNATP